MKIVKIFTSKEAMPGRNKGSGILMYSRVKTEILKNKKREKKKM